MYTVSQFPKRALYNALLSHPATVHFIFIRILLWCKRCGLLNLLTSIICTLSSHSPGEQYKGGEGEQQQQSCPCQLDPTHPPSGKRVPCVLCDISTISASWTSDTCCQHSQHHWFKFGDWRPWPNNWVHLCCGCRHSSGQTAKHSSSRSVHATSVIGLTYILPICMLLNSSSTSGPMPFQVPASFWF